MSRNITKQKISEFFRIFLDIEFLLEKPNPGNLLKSFRKFIFTLYQNCEYSAEHKMYHLQNYS